MINKLFCFALILGLFTGCSYKFNGASIPPEMKTLDVRFFENTAPLVEPTLSQLFTESLKTRIRNQTRLSLTTNDPQAIFEGRITGYDIKPTSLQSNSQPTAAVNRLTITVSVKYTNSLNEKNNFDQSFSKYYEFPLNGAPLQSILPTALENINKQLTEDIFNRAFAQW